MSNEESIDLNKLSQKELLIRLYDHMKNLEKSVSDIKRDGESRHEKMQEEISKLKVRVAVIETKAAAYGAVAGIVISVLVKLLF